MGLFGTKKRVNTVKMKRPTGVPHTATLTDPCKAAIPNQKYLHPKKQRFRFCFVEIIKQKLSEIKRKIIDFFFII